MQITMIEPGNREQAQAVVKQAADLLREGGLVVFPTETVYGVAASAASDVGMRRLRELKADGQARPFTVHLPNPRAAERYIDLASPPVQRLVDKAFPGPVTLVIDVDETTIDQHLKALGLPRDRIYRDKSVSLRCPDHALTQQLLSSIDQPVTAAAAHRPGQSPPHDAAAAADALEGQVDLVIDGGRSRYARPSTVVRVTGEGTTRHIEVEREGVYDERYIRKMLRWTMLLVCSGNTCRSPMAEGIARKMLAEARGIREDELEAASIRVLSAGVAALPGARASEHAVEALGKQGIDLTRHRSRTLSYEMIQEADVIYTMTESHRQAVLHAAPWAEHKTFTLDPRGDIDDPIGTGATSYQRTAEMIRRRLELRLKEQQP
ncbi:MAG: L-threonylcarbamoyladenylate synthase [Phycisphaeraceae bacterium]